MTSPYFIYKSFLEKEKEKKNPLPKCSSPLLKIVILLTPRPTFPPNRKRCHMYDWMKLILTKSWLRLQEFLIEVGHEADGISRNGDFDTPLHVAVEFSEAVAKLLAKRFPRCIAFRNKKGADPVRLAANHFAPPSPFFILFYFLKKPPPPPQFVFVLSSVYMRPSFSLSSSEIFCYFEVGAGGKRKKEKN